MNSTEFVVVDETTLEDVEISVMELDLRELDMIGGGGTIATVL